MNPFSRDDHHQAAAHVRSWRATTATRAFVLALAAGQALSVEVFRSLGITLLAIGLLSLVSAVLELDPGFDALRWGTAVEGVLVAVLVGTSTGPVEPLVICLIVPSVVAGIRHGWLSSLNTSLAAGIAIVAVWAAPGDDRLASELAPSVVPWLVVGLGAGLLAGWLTRSIRQLEATQAPYEAAHRLVGQLHLLTREVPMGLDGHSVGRELLDRARIAALATRASLLVRSGEESLVPVAGHGPGEPEDQAVARACLMLGHETRTADITAMPLQVGDHTFAVIVLAGEDVAAHMEEVRVVVDELAMQLETALLFDEVRSLATSEERKRLARDIHDGIAQRIVVVGYLIDELAECTRDEETRRAAEALRLEVSRVIIELRSSVFDLRHGENEADGLSGALTEYVREVATLSGLQVHLRLDISGSALSRRTEGELLGVAEEAVANVRKHADATNLWVSLTTDGRHIHLEIEDDGAGLPAERPGHYGLNTMRDRARRINADLTITDRPDGGTIVALQTRPASATPEGDTHVDSRPSRR